MTFGTKVVCLGQEVVCAVNSSSFFVGGIYYFVKIKEYSKFTLKRRYLPSNKSIVHGLLLVSVTQQLRCNISSRNYKVI